jgi:hypothetical protein
MTHGEFARLVLDQAAARGLHVHCCRMITSQRGWPDLVIVGRGGVLWRELKIPPDGLRSAQRALGYSLTASGQDWAVWTPADLESGRVEKELETIR